MISTYSRNGQQVTVQTTSRGVLKRFTPGTGLPFRKHSDDPETTAREICEDLEAAGWTLQETP